MKAAVIYEAGDPSVLRYEDVPIPSARTAASWSMPRRSASRAATLGAPGPSPAARDAAHRRLSERGDGGEVGAGVSRPRVGDRVVALNAAGSHAERRAVPAMMTWPIPDGLDAAQAACVPVAFGTAHECLFTAGELEAGQTALIHAGAGGVGVAAIQLAKQAGATVFSTASSDAKLERSEALGLDHGINYASENFVERISELTETRGVDIVLDSIGGQNLIDSVGRSPTAGRWSASARRAGRQLDHRGRTLWAKTPRFAACSSAARSSANTLASTR